MAHPGEEGDGAIVNWLSAEDVKVVAPLVGVDKEVAARIFVMPSEDRAAVRAMGTRLIAEYMNVPVYAAFHEWIGRGEAFRDMWDAWKAGDRKKATESIPDEVLDALIVNGSPEECAEHVKKYAANGITTPMPMMLASPDDTMKVLRALAPSA
jgi:alkanesulfonate monooxygenase SsuD/methylene tetrahydromethanopterin reductase-like flavin-dependent oxidoreductase (luciferase family)